MMRAPPASICGLLIMTMSNSVNCIEKYRYGIVYLCLVIFCQVTMVQVKKLCSHAPNVWLWKQTQNSLDSFGSQMNMSIIGNCVKHIVIDDAYLSLVSYIVVLMKEKTKGAPNSRGMSPRRTVLRCAGVWYFTCLLYYLCVQDFSTDILYVLFNILIYILYAHKHYVPLIKFRLKTIYIQENDIHVHCFCH